MLTGWPRRAARAGGATLTRGLTLHVIPYLWSGAGAVVTRLCETQRRDGPVAIVTAGTRGDRPDWATYRARLRRAGVLHRTIDFYHREAGAFWSGATALAALLRELRPEVVHAHAGVPCCGAVVARDLSGHPARVIGQMYSWGPDRPEWMNRQDAWGFARADRVVCSARDYWTLLVRYGVPGRKLAYLPWGLPLEDLPWRGDRRPAGHAGPVIGFVGRIEPRKGQLALVEAFAHLARTHPDARLELVGPVADEAYFARVRAAVASAHLDGVVSLLGEVRDVTRQVRGWDLFVSMSADEGQGLAALEAMAIGVPVVARRVAGIADFLVHGRTGFALESGSPRRAASAIARAFSTHAELRAITRRARTLVERRYSWARTVAAFDHLYTR